MSAAFKASEASVLLMICFLLKQTQKLPVSVLDWRIKVSENELMKLCIVTEM